ncbi:MAG: hypothetical protein Q7R88_00090 [bacterium]|nr:hypothetical protein [bacterium]
MNKQALTNAVLASLYIFLVVCAIFYGSEMVEQMVGVVPETMLIPVAMLSLFVLSAAIMGYLFVYHPAALYLEGKKTEAVRLFLSTTAIFAGITMVIFALVFFGAFSAPSEQAIEVGSRL